MNNDDPQFWFSITARSDDHKTTLPDNEQPVLHRALGSAQLREHPRSGGHRSPNVGAFANSRAGGHSDHACSAFIESTAFLVVLPMFVGYLADDNQ
ncbi:hypothetical protein ACQPXH_17535 [Nocardia sp. CA-135953]|uniref:hypothetical protein n=1 Tax=Nocardia sp. CA-135953 TaxID=3239978 RepID=UPI003D95584C